MDKFFDDELDRRIDRVVRFMIHGLKNEADPTGCGRSYEFFDIDKDFDVAITIRLNPKKSQFEIGKQMFEGKK